MNKTGTITANKDGRTTITAETTSGYIATCVVIVGDFKGVEIESVSAVGGSKLTPVSGEYNLSNGSQYIIKVKLNHLGYSNLTNNLDSAWAKLQNDRPTIDVNGDSKIYEYKILTLKEGSYTAKFMADDGESAILKVKIGKNNGGGSTTQGEIKLYRDYDLKEQITGDECYLENWYSWLQVYVPTADVNFDDISCTGGGDYVWSIETKSMNSGKLKLFTINLNNNMFRDGDSTTVTFKNKITGKTKNLKLIMRRN